MSYRKNLLVLFVGGSGLLSRLHWRERYFLNALRCAKPSPRPRHRVSKHAFCPSSFWSCYARTVSFSPRLLLPLFIRECCLLTAAVRYFSPCPSSRACFLPSRACCTFALASLLHCSEQISAVFLLALHGMLLGITLPCALIFRESPAFVALELAITAQQSWFFQVHVNYKSHGTETWYSALHTFFTPVHFEHFYIITRSNTD